MQLGLSSSQSKIYLSLISNGETAVNTIAKASNIDRGETYRVIYKLMEVGLVEKFIDFPIRFKAIPLAEGLSILLKRKKQADSEIQKCAEELLANSPVEDYHAIFKKEEPRLSLVPPGEHLTKLLSEKFINLKKSYDVTTFLTEFDRNINNHYMDYQRLLTKGVTIRCVIENLEGKNIGQSFSDIFQNSNFKIKFARKRIPAYLGIYDDREVRISVETNARIYHAPTYWSNNPVFVAISKSYFETLWQRPELGVDFISVLERL